MTDTFMTMIAALNYENLFRPFKELSKGKTFNEIAFDVAFAMQYLCIFLGPRILRMIDLPQ